MLWTALLLGIVEGLTEFLPVSSTGHLILTERLIGFEGKRAEVFAIFIQLGAILAVVWDYRARLRRIARDLPRSAAAREHVMKVGLAFLPSAVIGLMVHDFMVNHLFVAGSVATALVVGGVLILIVERLPLRARTHDIDSVGWGQAFGIGLAQCFSLWPGFSRSAATILGGLTVGLDRRTATEFSFLLAIPTMFGAASYDLIKNYRALSASDLLWLAVSFAVAFFVALATTRWLLRYVSNHSFQAFAWYRIAIGLLILFILNG